MPSKLQKLLVLAVIGLFTVTGNNALSQSVQVREHKKVPFTKKTTLKIIKNNGVTFDGKWQMETAEAISVKLSSGREIIIPKSDIAELYQCNTRTNEYFYYGFLIGTVTGLIIVYADQAGPRDISGFFAASAFGAFCGLAGAVYGSLQQSCERYYFEDVPPSITEVGSREKCRLELGFRFNF